MKKWFSRALLAILLALIAGWITVWWAAGI
jgi:hypothetical protein